MWEAFPYLNKSCNCGDPVLWVVVRRDGNGVVICGAAIVSTFMGPDAERDAKCHAAKLNERESGPASPKEVAEEMKVAGGRISKTIADHLVAGMSRPELASAVTDEELKGAGQ